jgi:hypothetical protein
MEKNILPGLKSLFLVHMIVGIIFGLIFLLIPEIWGNLIGWPVTEPVIYRLYAAALLGLTASSWFAYKETAWDRVKIVVQMEIIWLILGTLVTLWGLFFAGAPVFASWLYFVILAGLAIAFSFFYRRIV